jgi:hypothetical protein
VLNLNIYQENGYRNRKEYLNELSEIYDQPLSLVYGLANMLGEIEDFDGLLIALEDAEVMM